MVQTFFIPVRTSWIYILSRPFWYGTNITKTFKCSSDIMQAFAISWRVFLRPYARKTWAYIQPFWRAKQELPKISASLRSAVIICHYFTFFSILCSYFVNKYNKSNTCAMLNLCPAFKFVSSSYLWGRQLSVIIFHS